MLGGGSACGGAVRLPLYPFSAKYDARGEVGPGMGGIKGTTRKKGQGQGEYVICLKKNLENLLK